jgi:hypothetical protein
LGQQQTVHPCRWDWLRADAGLAPVAPLAPVVTLAPSGARAARAARAMGAVAMGDGLTDTINDEIARLDARIEQQLASIPGVAPACTACGLTGGGHAPGCASTDSRPGPGGTAR